MSKVKTVIWEQVKQIFEEALEYKAGERTEFLERACEKDPTLRREVESLLKAHEKAGSFMETPAIHATAESFVGAKLKVGDRLKHYEILDLIGEGGMGEVYLARDSVLGRRVAIKLLPSDFTNDLGRLRRFKQEARTASALSHPNVSVIHEVGETEDRRPFIAMEYIEGMTLRQLIKQGPLPVGQTLDIAIQIANALTAAHEEGIVHRDIKPENIMIRADGYVKVLDFGLAKLAERPSTRIDSTEISTLLAHSTPGTVMGTVGYMSPEQARAVAIDSRTDIWSLGVVIYEMAAGRPPFEGATPTDVVIAIVEREQRPITYHGPAVAEELERIVRKALRKDPDERYQLAKEMAIDLRTLRRELDFDAELDRSVPPSSAGEVKHIPTQEGRAFTTVDEKVDTGKFHFPGTTTGMAPYRNFSGAALGLLALVLILVLGGGFGIYKLLQQPEASSPSRFNRIRVTKLTTNGTATFAAISPDGRYVAYVMNEAGKESLWLRQVSVPGNVQLVPSGTGLYLGVAFSPDGNFLYYGYAESDRNESGEMYRIPLLGMGDTPTRLNRHVGPAVLSHDRKRIAFIRYDVESQTDRLVMADADESNEQVLATRQWPARLGWDWDTKPAWGPDDKTITIPQVNSDAGGSIINLYEMDLTTRAERVVSLSSERFEQLGHVGLLPDASGVIISAKAKGASFSQIWKLSRDGQLRSITNDLSDYQDSRLTADGSAFVTVQTQTLSNIWLAATDAKDASQITGGSGRYYDLGWTPDGKVIYASDASGSADIFEMEADGSRTRQITANAGRNYGPSISPDGRYIVFHSNRSGIFQIWRVDRDGGNPKQLTAGNSESTWPQVSPDGNWVFYQHFEAGVPQTIWKVAIDGGTPVGVTEGHAIRPAVSPDGRWLASWQNDGQANSRWQLFITPLTTAGPTKVFDVAPTVLVRWDTLLRWGPDGRSVTYVDHRGGIDNLWAQSIDGAGPKQVTHFQNSQIFSFDWSREGRLVASRGVKTSDVVLIADEDAR